MTSEIRDASPADADGIALVHVPRRFYEAADFTTDGAEQTEDIAGAPVTEVRYRRDLP